MAPFSALPEALLDSILGHAVHSLDPASRSSSLAQLTLVSKAFVPPARRLLLSKLEFTYLHGDAKLMELLNGRLLPEVWCPERLSFCAMAAEDVGECVGRARTLGQLRLEHIQGTLPREIFECSSLRELGTLDCGPGVHFHPETAFPSRLKSLHLSSPQPAAPLFRSLFSFNSHTLRSLHFLLSTATALNNILDVFPRVADNLTCLSIVNGWLYDGDPLPHPLKNLIGSCGSLRHLRVEGFSLPQLKPLVECVPTQLETLTMEDIVGDHEGGWRKASLEIGAVLSECAAARPMAGLAEWRLLVPELRGDWRDERVWKACEQALRERGTSLVWLKQL